MTKTPTPRAIRFSAAIVLCLIGSLLAGPAWAATGAAIGFDAGFFVLAFLFGVGGTAFWFLRVAQPTPHPNRGSSEILSTSVAAVYVIDEKGRCTYANAAAIDILGYKSETDLLDQNMHDLVHHSHADGRTYDAADCQIFEAYRQGAEVHLDVETLWRRDGSQFATELWSRPLRDAGRVVGAVVTFIDISRRITVADALKQSEELFSKVFRSSPGLAAITDPQTGEHFDVNEAWASILGWERCDAIGKTAFEMGIWSDLADREAIVQALGDSGRVQGYEAQLRTKTGEARDFIISGEVLALSDRTRQLLIAYDITDRKKAETNLRKLSQAVEQNPVSIMITDRDGHIEYVNAAFEKVSGYRFAEIQGQTPSFLKSGRVAARVYVDLWKTIAAGQDWQGELLNRNKQGELFWVQSHVSPVKGTDGKITHYVSMHEDLTLRKKQEQQLIKQAHYDSLTGLPNRLVAMDRLSQTIKAARRDGRQAALMSLDLDDFKKINDTLGHEIGDELLRDAAKRLAGVTRDTDTVARFGGDEFLAILGDLDGIDRAERTAQGLLAAFTEPFTIHGMDLVVTASVGLAVYPDDGTVAEILLRNADAAMTRSKEMGRNTYCFFSPAMNERARHDLELEQQLRGANERGELALNYQLIVDAASGQPVAVETLLRWRSPMLGDVDPDQFVPVAERTGLINAIGDWVLESACRQVLAWEATGLPPLEVAVNISPRQIQDSRLFQNITDVLDRTGLPPARLALELTEGVLVRNRQEAWELLNKLSGLGVHLSLDDFGTGYASLSYLKSFPFHALKIDRSFVREMDSRDDDRALTAAAIAMAHSLGLQVVAEGVETRRHLDLLYQEGCDRVQGAYLAPPLAPDRLAETVRNWRAGDHAAGG